ncbi:hypothetical protein L2E82_12490 [Cichorium intybus]|uniref:Uncharacterized protein n=1 Tax=Cichorium intybus TaxID=13427 RepID=A0ACB9GGY9_CICIN|nr:hypothetical protein L2E82_12490 [Cichorium intybus]
MQSKSVRSVFPVVVPILPVHDPLIDWYDLQIAKCYDPVRVPKTFGTRSYCDWVQAIRNVECGYFSDPCDYAQNQSGVHFQSDSDAQELLRIVGPPCKGKMGEPKSRSLNLKLLITIVIFFMSKVQGFSLPANG